ncbi:MAG: FtsW/RodA/SpoVE family cell cycle protein, partial [Candidatus Velamenicoccus archaeovorus]
MSQAAVPAPRPRQRAAIALTILALVLTVGAYALVGLGKRGRLPIDLALYGSLFAIGYAIASVVIRRAAPWADPALFPIAG